MILLVVTQYPMTIPTNADGSIVAVMTGDMVKLDALPARIAANGAPWIVGAEHFQAALLSCFAVAVFPIHRDFLQNEPVNFVKRLVPGVGETVERVRIGFEQVGFAFGVDHRAALKRLQKLNIV